MNARSCARAAALRIIVPLLTSWPALALIGCRSMDANSPSTARVPELVVPFTPATIHVDGKLDEPLYQAPPLVERFVIAGQPDKRPPATRAWLFWQPQRLIFAFECEDAEIVAAPPSGNKHDVDAQDRVELFLWSGQPEDTYYCLEVGALGALHDYAARFYRRFDDTWSLPGLQYAVSRTPHGYCVEGTIPRAALQQMGFRLEPGARWRLGLFRAEFTARDRPGEPTWITWVNAQTPQPDFHVAASFGACKLAAEK